MPDKKKNAIMTFTYQFYHNVYRKNSGRHGGVPIIWFVSFYVAQQWSGNQSRPPAFTPQQLGSTPTDKRNPLD